MSGESRSVTTPLLGKCMSLMKVAQVSTVEATKREPARRTSSTRPRRQKGAAFSLTKTEPR
jgi:hypothetical protein